MGKRKVESDEDEDWGQAVKKTASRTTQKRVSRTTTRVATQVKNEALEDAINHLMGSAVADSSTSIPEATTSAPTADDVEAVPAKTARKKRVKKEVDAPVEEKRLARIRKSCPKNIQERLERVQSQRMFMVDRTPREGDELLEQFKVLGSTGNVYTIVIKHVPTCDCPDALKGNHCKHLLFVLLKVLGVPADSPNIYQKALLTSELEEIFANAPQAPSASVQHAGLKKAWAKATGSPVKDEGEDDEGGKKRVPEDGDTCPVCFDDFGEDMNAIVYCETSCGGPIHQVCLAQWLTTKPEPTCVYCRAPWPKNGAGGAGPSRDGAYLNLGGAVGLSTTRDTSTYYHGPRRGMTQRQAYYAAAARYNGGTLPFEDEDEEWEDYEHDADDRGYM